MSQTDASGFGQFVPGFDFLKSLGQGRAAMPGLDHWNKWVAPTLDPEALDKRIEELKVVQFWLEQNATALKATIQALEVQKMTAATLRGMNLNTAELARVFTATQSSTPPSAPPSAASATDAAASPQASAAPAPKRKAKPSSKTTTQAASSAPSPDPVQFWGALTQQFQHIAAQALQDVASQAAKVQPAATRAADTASAARTRRTTTRTAGTTRTTRTTRTVGAAPRRR